MNFKERDAPYRLRKVIVIYALADPDTDLIRYVGSSKHPHERLIQHRSVNKNEHSHRITEQAKWWGSLLDRGLSPRLIVLEEIPDTSSLRQCLDIENMWARRLVERGEPLTNFTGHGVGRAQVTLDVAALIAIKKIEDKYGLDRDGAALHAILEYAKTL